MTESRSSLNDVSVLVATVVVLLLAFAPSLTAVLPQVYWDVDPRASMSESVMDIGPLGAGVVAMLSVMASGVAMLVHARMGGRLSWKTTALAVAGLAVCAYHLPRDGEGAITLASWMGGMSLAVAAYHLAQHARARLLIIAAVAAMVVPWLFHSLLYVWVDHPATVKSFLDNETSHVAARGWQMGSAQHELYKRRMMFSDVTGPYGLSNVYGSMVAAAGIISATFIAWFISCRKYRHALAPAGLLACSVVVVHLTHSKGAQLAMLMGVCIVVLMMLGWRWKWAAKLLPAAAALGVAAVLMLVLVRGWMGPPDTAAGERSVLFRYHYWQGAAGIMADESWGGRLLGVGVGAFKEHYTQHKNPLNPEEVTSTHSVMVDYIAMLGAGGVAWSVLLLAWLWMAGRGALAMKDEPAVRDAPRAPTEGLTASEQTLVSLAAALAGCMLVYRFTFQFPVLLAAEHLLALVLGCLSVMAVTGWFCVQLGRDRQLGRVACVAMFPAAAVLMFHGQVEMTFFNHQAAPLALVIVAAAAGAAQQKPLERAQEEVSDSSALAHLGRSAAAQPSCVIVAVVLILGGVAMLAGYVSPLSKQQRALKAAAEELRVGQVAQSLALLDKAIEALPRDPRTYESKAGLYFEGFIVLANQKQMMPARVYLTELFKTLDAAHAAGVERIGLLRLRSRANEMAAKLLAEPGRLVTATNVLQELLRRAPYSLMDSLHMADLLEAQGNSMGAGQYYQYTMRIHEWSYLDPARQLSPEDLKRVQSRLYDDAP